MPTLDATNGHIDHNDTSPNAKDSDSRTWKFLADQTSPPSTSGASFVFDNKRPVGAFDRYMSMRNGAGAEVFAMLGNGARIATVDGIFNVRAFGATGNGVTDDTAAIAAAYAYGGPGACYFYPQGNYLVSGNPALTPPQASTHIGASRGGSISITPLCSRFTYTGSGDCMLIDNKQGITLKQLKFIITGSSGPERAIHIINSAGACQWNNFEDLYIQQFANNGASPRIVGQVGILLQAVQSAAMSWCHFRRIILQNWDIGMDLTGNASNSVPNGHSFSDIMGASNTTLFKMEGFVSDNYLVGLFASSSGFVGAQTAIVVGDGTNPCSGNRFYGVTSDAGASASPFFFDANTFCNHIEVDGESSLAGTDNGSFNTVKYIKPNTFVTETLGTISTPYSSITYSASMTPNARLGNTQEISATNGTAFTINAPTNPRTGQPLTIKVKNASGGALGVATWNAAFKMAAWTQPLNANSRSITFIYDGTNWVESTRTTADVPN